MSRGRALIWRLTNPVPLLGQDQMGNAGNWVRQALVNCLAMGKPGPPYRRSEKG